MKSYAICCIGHVTLDKIVNPTSTVFMPGGTAYYFSYALSKLCTDYLLVTAVADEQLDSVKELQDIGVVVKRLPSKQTVAFENRYGENTDERTQRVWQQADTFRLSDVEEIKAEVFHLGPLLADDISSEIIMALAAKARVSLDVQGLLRYVRNEEVIPIDWPEKKDLLPHVYFLKVNEAELKTLTNEDDVEQGARQLAEWGVKEIIITLGSKGSVIYSNEQFHQIPSYQPNQLIDATGCGDTYMAGYLFQRIQNRSIQEAGEFAAAMATCKLQVAGPFRGTQQAVLNMMNKSV